MLHPVVRSDPDEIRALLDQFNAALAPDGYQLVQESTVSGRPVYGARRTDSFHAAGPPLALSQRPLLTDPTVLHQHLARIRDGLDGDPSAAIGSCKELVESLCKIILERSSIAYPAAEDLPGLYRLVADLLRLKAEAVPSSAKGSATAQKILRTLSTTVQRDATTLRWRDSYPAAVRCLLADRESLTVYLRFPREHWPRVRHSNFIERTFGETRRRVKVIGRLPGEHSVTSLVWAVLDRASTGWRGFTMTAAGLRLLHDLRRTLLEPPPQLRSRGEPPAADQHSSEQPTQEEVRSAVRPPSPTLTLLTAATPSRTASGVYECPGCGERLAGTRRCEDCNLFARRLGEGGCCPTCSDIITIQELLDIR